MGGSHESPAPPHITGGLTARDLRVCVVYMFLASVMWVVNKKTITHLPVPFFVTLVQALATCAILKVAQHLKVITMQPFSWETFGEWINTGIVWAVPLALNLRALTRLNPETLIVFRTATLIGVTAGDYAYYGKRFETREMVSIATILTGCAFYAWYDAQFDAEGYAWAALYWFAMVVSMLYVKHSFNVHKELSTWDKTVYLNATASVPLAFMSLLFECSASEYDRLSPSGMTWLLSSCLAGVALASASNGSRECLSATAFDVMSTASKFATILLSSFIFASTYTPQSMGGLMVALAGGSLYSPVGVWAVRCVAAREHSNTGAELASPNSGDGGGGGGAEGGGLLRRGLKSCIGARRVTW
eukprot:CAMPEP_0181353386 /NCGR_PEP_ID=MMETSP1106-20121128/2808_1 /TAXON_ID=81844 /ORGANISM="Mantoniella antarctica, Strain SL-175" /LENGTH=359 /DNA_ID=CAMNT_0023465995 /DNA_START=111 /DNA_END=1187 /DNA_ORIENTATION=-